MACYEHRDDADGWEWFVKRTLPGWGLVFMPVVRTADGDTLVAYSFLRRVLAVFGCGAGAVLMAYLCADFLGSWRGWTSVPGVAVTSFVALVLTWAIVSAVLGRGCVSWRIGGAHVHLCGGLWPFERTLRIPKSELRLHLSLISGEKSRSGDVGQFVLSLSHASLPGEVRIARATSKCALAAAADQLSSFLGREVQDDAVQEEVTVNGTVIPVNRAPVARSGEVCSVQAAVDESLFGGRFPWFPMFASFGIAASGIMLAAVLCGAGFDEGLVFTSVLGGAFASACFMGLAYLKPDPCTAVRRQGVYVYREGGPRYKLAGRENVAAVQVCSYVCDDADDIYCVYHEINLVLLSPPGERVNVCTMGEYRDRHAARVMADAERMARVLRVPVLDHSSISAKQRGA